MHALERAQLIFNEVVAKFLQTTGAFEPSKGGRRQPLSKKEARGLLRVKVIFVFVLFGSSIIQYVVDESSLAPRRRGGAPR